MTVCYVNSIVFWELAIQPTPDWKGPRKRVAVVGELVEPQAMEPKGGTPESPKKWPPCHFYGQLLRGPSTGSGSYSALLGAIGS